MPLGILPSLRTVLKSTSKLIARVDFSKTSLFLAMDALRVANIFGRGPGSQPVASQI